MYISGWSASSSSSHYARTRNSAFLGAMLFLACAPSYTRAQAPTVSNAEGTGIPDLIVALRHPKPETRADARAALVKAGPKAVPALVAGIGSDRSREIMTQILREIGPRAVPELIVLLKSPELRIRAGAALFQVAGPGSADQTPALLDCLHDPAVNNYCGTTMVKVMGPKAKGQVPRLRKALKDSDTTVRLYAAAALGQIGPMAQEAVPGLIVMLQDPEPAVRLNAVQSLGKVGRGAREAIPALKLMRRDRNDVVKNAVKEALKKIHG